MGRTNFQNRRVLLKGTVQCSPTTTAVLPPAGATANLTFWGVLVSCSNTKTRRRVPLSNSVITTRRRLLVSNSVSRTQSQLLVSKSRIFCRDLTNGVSHCQIQSPAVASVKFGQHHPPAVASVKFGQQHPTVVASTSNTRLAS